MLLLIDWKVLLSVFVLHLVNSPGSFPECLTLNLSNNSGSLPSGRLSALSQHSDKGGNKSDSEGEEESSDWDSWDEEPEVRCLFCSILQDKFYPIAIW